MRLLHTAIWFIYFFAYLVYLLPRRIRIKRLIKKGKFEKADSIIQKTVSKWAKGMLSFAGIKLEVEGEENIPDGAAVFACNHQSMFDIPTALVGLKRPNGFITKTDAQKIPLIKDWMKYLGCVFIDRDSPRKAMAAINEGAHNIESGKSMIIFPEGTRSKDGNLGEFKNGAFKMAQKSKAPIIPVAIIGSRKALEGSNYRITPTKIKIKILPEIDVSELSKSEIKNLGEITRNKIMNAMCIYC